MHNTLNVYRKYRWNTSIYLILCRLSTVLLFCVLSPGGVSEPVRRRSPLNLTLVVVVVVVVLVLFLAIVDVSCYFMNSCGVTMFVCVHVCGQQPHTAIDHGTDELERLPSSPDVFSTLEMTYVMFLFHSSQVKSSEPQHLFLADSESPCVRDLCIIVQCACLVTAVVGSYCASSRAKLMLAVDYGGRTGPDVD